MIENIKPFRILSLDGGGAKGVYTLGVLKEVEALCGKPLCEVFDLIYGTSTGSIIGTALALGWSVDDVYRAYLERVPLIMKRYTAGSRSRELASAVKDLFGSKGADFLKTDLAIVATDYNYKRPLIFKSSIKSTYAMKKTFVPFFGVKLADAIEASCSASPFFNIKNVNTDNQGLVSLVDGGFCANNPSILALVDAQHAFKIVNEDIKILSVGVGVYPLKYSMYSWLTFIPYVSARNLLSLQFDTSSNFINSLFSLVVKEISHVRVSDVFAEPHLATSLLEHDIIKLGKLKNKGRDSYSSKEEDIKKLLE